MKKLLPKTSRNPQGFTLVELMVVIAILAILAIIGSVVFTNISKGARDARRKADIDAIGTAMESFYGNTTEGQYSALDTAMFSQKAIPQDPQRTLTNCTGGMCIYCSLTTAGACPASGYAEVTGAVPAAGTSYVVCANLESATPAYYCRSNQRK